MVTSTSRIPIVLLSSINNFSDESELAAEGFDAHLVKPVRPSHLVAAISAVLEKPDPDQERPLLITKRTILEAGKQARSEENTTEAMSFTWRPRRSSDRPRARASTPAHDARQ